MNMSKVSTRYTGRIGNKILTVYRAFWFAAVHNIPLSNVLIPSSDDIVNSPLFDNIKGNFVSGDVVQNTVFTKSYNAWGVITDKQRRELFDIEMPDDGSIVIWESPFLYPEHPWELGLFNYIFDNQTSKQLLAKKYDIDLTGSSVALVIRRGDMKYLRNFRTLSTDCILDLLADIIKKHNGLVHILVSTDDVGFVRNILNYNTDIGKYVTVVEETPSDQIITLSLCDHVINNGQYQTSSAYVDYAYPTIETTFGQIAQLLNKSYKYRQFIDVRNGLVYRSDGTDFTDSFALSKSGGLFSYPTIIPVWNEPE